jgi:hypothetical protein
MDASTKAAVHGGHFRFIRRTLVSLTAPERETTINANDEEDTAHVYTAQPSMIRRRARHPQAKLIERHLNESGQVTGEEPLVRER